MKQKLQRFFAGRYGMDQLNKFLFIFAFVLIVLSSFMKNSTLLGMLLYLLGLVAWAYELYRLMSKDYYRRKSENERYLKASNKYRHQLMVIYYNLKDRNNSYFVCPECTKIVRVPKGKGSIIIHCPNCNCSFDRKS